MKVLHQDFKGPMTFTYYHWNNKYILKIELDNYEQTYKINEMDVKSIEDIKALGQNESFIDGVFTRFQAMDEDLSNTIR